MHLFQIMEISYYLKKNEIINISKTELPLRNSSESQLHRQDPNSMNKPHNQCSISPIHIAHKPSILCLFRKKLITFTVVLISHFTYTIFINIIMQNSILFLNNNSILACGSNSIFCKYLYNAACISQEKTLIGSRYIV